MTRKLSLRIVRPRRPPPVFVCKRCLKRAGDGRAIKRALKAELKSRAKIGGGKRPRVVTTGCFHICPGRAVVAASEATLRRREYALLSHSDDVAAAIDVLMPDQTGGA